MAKKVKENTTLTNNKNKSTEKKIKSPKRSGHERNIKYTKQNNGK
jgi:hypothetical protein